MKKYRIEGVIGLESTAANLAAFLQEAGGDDVELTMSSPGGLVNEALDMFNQVRNYEGNVRAVLSGFAMSAASYIPMAASEVVAEDNAIMMIHNARGLAIGDHNEMEKTAKIMRGMSAMISGAYAKFTGKKREEIAELMDNETWFFGSEIEENGFAHATKKVESEEGQEEVTAFAQLAFDDMMATLKSNAKAYNEDLSRAATALGSIGDVNPNNKQEDASMNLEQLKEQHPELVEAISNEATAGLEDKLTEAREEGIKAENARIQEVIAQTVPGHEELVNSLAYDMKTTGPEAAVQVIQAEKKLRENALEDFKNDAPDAIPEANSDNADRMTDEEKVKAEWEKDAELRSEFVNDYELYLAYLKEDEGVKVKTLKNRGE